MVNLFIVGMGGFAGSALRYLLSGLLQKLSGTAFFPVGTLGVNVAGCLLVGLMGGWADNREVFSAETRLFLLIGVLGGFTTFSTFGYETLSLLRDQQVFHALSNVALHVVLGLGAVWLGYALTLIR